MVILCLFFHHVPIAPDLWDLIPSTCREDARIGIRYGRVNSNNSPVLDSLQVHRHTTPPSGTVQNRLENSSDFPSPISMRAQHVGESRLCLDWTAEWRATRRDRVK